MKTEPHEFSIDKLKAESDAKKFSIWDGVRNYQARNFIRAMKKNDQIFIYHSNTKVPGIVGVAKIIDEAFPDPTQFDPKSKYYDSSSPKENPRWWVVRLAFVEKFKKEVSLEELKEIWEPEDSPVVRKGNRLSVCPVLRKTAVEKVLTKAGAETKIADAQEKKESGKRRQRDE